MALCLVKDFFKSPFTSLIRALAVFFFFFLPLIILKALGIIVSIRTFLNMAGIYGCSGDLRTSFQGFSILSPLAVCRTAPQRTFFTSLRVCAKHFSTS